MSNFPLDKNKFEELYLHYYPMLMVYGKSIANDEALIEDTIQELFLTLWQKRNTFLVKTTLDTYLFVAFRNNLIRKLKQRTKKEIYDIPDTAIDEPIALDLEKTANLRQLLEKLPPRQKEVLYLRYYKNKSYQEIAEILGISYQVARNFSYRAIKFLKKHMKHLSSVLLSIVFYAIHIF